MTTTDERFKARFRAIFATGLEDIKLFLRPDRPGQTGAGLRAELDAMQAAVGTKSEKRIYTVDGHMPQVRFDAPFD